MELPEPDRRVLVEVNRTVLCVWEWGDRDAPVIVLAHGAHDHGRMWDGFAPRVAELGYRVLAPDLRGHGDSGRLPHGHIWAMTAMDLATLARRESEEPVGIIGHSFGGGLSTYAAGVWPEQFAWVVNLDGLGPPDDFEEEEREDLATAMTRSFEWLERVFFEPPRVYKTLDEMIERRAATNYRLPREWVEHLVRHGSRPVDGGFVWKADPRFRTGLPGEFDSEFLAAEQELTACPILVLTGSEPDAWSHHEPELVAKRITNFQDVRHRVIDGAGHYVHVEQPDAVLGEIRAFLASLEPAVAR